METAAIVEGYRERISVNVFRVTLAGVAMGGMVKGFFFPSPLSLSWWMRGLGKVSRECRVNE